MTPCTQLAQADVKNHTVIRYTVEFKRRVLLRHEESGNISLVSRELSVPAGDLDNNMESQDIGRSFY